MKKGFTLAEVLITLMIIGVIAMITLPALTQTYKNKVRITQIKLAYSLVNNIVKRSVADNGAVVGWYDFNMKDYILPYVKYTKYCGAGTGATVYIGSGCFSPSPDSYNNGTWYYLNGNSATSSHPNYNPRWYYTMKLENGMDMGVKIESEYIKFVIDVNGKEGPTVAGNDVFSFTLKRKNGLVSTLTPGHVPVTSNDLLTCTTNECCNVNANSGGGLSCAKVLELNNWQIPDNYPVKF